MDPPPRTCDALRMTELALSIETPLESWRIGLGCALAAVGSLTILRGVALLSWRRRSWPAWALTYLFVFRRVVVGACLAGAGVGLADRIDWLLAASLCIGAGELLESSYYIGVLRHAGVTSIDHIGANSFQRMVDQPRQLFEEAAHVR
jgi:hypothetical protein